MKKTVTEKPPYACANSCLPRYIFYILLICATAVCVANLICLHKRLSKTHPTRNRNVDGRYKDSSMTFEAEDARPDGGSGRCGSTLRNLENIASKLNDILQKTTAKKSREKEQDMGSKHRSVFRYNIVLMAYKRSGSSFVGQLFNHHSDVLYFYEPIFFLKELQRIHGNAYRILSRRLLNTIFTCNFEENPYFVSQLSDSAFRLSSRVLSEPPMCPIKTNLDHVQEQCQRIHTSTLIDICQSHRHVVIKTIRVLDLDELKELRRFTIEAPWNIMKVIHLVRDPRAIINSRAHIDLSRHSTKWTMADYQTNARALCTQILNNLKKGVSEEAFEGMYHVIRYEDIATQTERATRQLYEFAGLSWSEKTSQWLRQNNLKTHEFHPFSTTKNATISLNLWRKQLDVEVIRIIEQECSIIMSLLGYNKVKTRKHLLDISRPLFRDNKSSTIYITKNITDVMLEIKNLKDHGLL